MADPFHVSSVIRQKGKLKTGVQESKACQNSRKTNISYPLIRFSRLLRFLNQCCTLAQGLVKMVTKGICTL